MRLALQTDYALRTLMYLATQQQRATAAEVARFFGISSGHVAKVVNQLSRLGYIRSIRGIGGGIELTRSPDRITVGEVVAAFEGNMHLLDCISSDGVCIIEGFCKLKSVLTQAESVQMDYLNSVSLSDVLPRKRQIDRLATSN